MSIPKVLVFGFGNPGRGDDGLGPLFVSELEKLGLAGIACQTDMQLQVEHIVDMQGRETVLFIDADVSCEAPFEFGEIKPAKDSSYTSHAMTPQAIMHSYSKVLKEQPPKTFLLRIRGERFELGDGLSPNALKHMQASRVSVLQFLRDMNIDC